MAERVRRLETHPEWREFMHAEECPSGTHTPCPTNYVEHLNWMAVMALTHRQKQCPTCGFFAVWVPKETA